jgi:putative PIN family toxin of toxin-antitoxin system
LAEEGFIRLYLSEEILTEIADVLNRSKVRARFPELTDEIVEEFLDQLRSTAEIAKRVPKRFTYPRDVDDEPYINLAVEAPSVPIWMRHLPYCKLLSRARRSVR